MFALLSEIPFDLLFSGGLNRNSQNVFWTLLIGLLVLRGMEGVRGVLRMWENSRIHSKARRPQKGRALYRAAEAAGILLVIAAGMCAAAFLKTDYSWRGVILIAVIGLLMRDRLLLVIDAPCAFLFTEFLQLFIGGRSLLASLGEVLSHLTVFVSFALIWFYNGERKRTGHRYFFYFFYPVHLLILFLFRQFLYALYG